MISYDEDRDLIKRYNLPLQTKRMIQELQGLSTSIIYDGKVTDEEVALLQQWCKCNDEYLTRFPLTDLKFLIMKILRDKIVTEEEKLELFNFLSNISTHPESNPVIEGIFQLKPIIQFMYKSFALTGELEFGSRIKAMNAIKNRGGECNDRGGVTTKTNYLVVGSLGSENYSFGRFGTKIEKAIAFNNEGRSYIQIVRERDFVKAVLGTPELTHSVERPKIKLIPKHIKHGKLCPFCGDDIADGLVFCANCENYLPID